MILVYHKVERSPETQWWVSAASFYRQMCELRGFDVVHLDDYDPHNPRHVVITFDGVYENVYWFAFPVLRAFGYPFELFVVSDHVGGDNSFDAPEPPCRFATFEQLAAMSRGGGRVQFHTRSHRRLDGALSEAERELELTVPDALRAIDPSGCTWFAYPHGDFSDEVVALARQRFRGAVTCVQGNEEDRHRLNRRTVTESTRLTQRTIGVVVASYNYGDFLVESVESVLRQTLPADRVLVIDDASDDATADVGRMLAETYPDQLTFHRNARNLGIVANFNRGVGMLSTDYVCILGADNRMPSHYLERCAAVLDADASRGIAYTDLALFGARAGGVYGSFPESWQAGETDGHYWNVEFPALEADEAAREIRSRNFVHGSSMYRRGAFDAVGGYRAGSGRPEDHDFFARMLDAGYGISKARTFLEYRHHSPDQANARLNLQLRLAAAERLIARQRERLDALDETLRDRDPLRRVARRVRQVRSSLRESGVRETARRIAGRIADRWRS